jgi:hypothetical protein
LGPADLCLVARYVYDSLDQALQGRDEKDDDGYCSEVLRSAILGKPKTIG